MGLGSNCGQAIGAAGKSGKSRWFAPMHMEIFLLFCLAPDIEFAPAYIETVSNRDPASRSAFAEAGVRANDCAMKTLARPAEKAEALRRILKGQRLPTPRPPSRPGALCRTALSKPCALFAGTRDWNVSSPLQTRPGTGHGARTAAAPRLRTLPPAVAHQDAGRATPGRRRWPARGEVLAGAVSGADRTASCVSSSARS